MHWKFSCWAPLYLLFGLKCWSFILGLWIPQPIDTIIFFPLIFFNDISIVSSFILFVLQLSLGLYKQCYTWQFFNVISPLNHFCTCILDAFKCSFQHYLYNFNYSAQYLETSPITRPILQLNSYFFPPVTQNSTHCPLSPASTASHSAFAQDRRCSPESHRL